MAKLAFIHPISTPHPHPPWNKQDGPATCNVLRWKVWCIICYEIVSKFAKCHGLALPSFVERLGWKYLHFVAQICYTGPKTCRQGLFKEDQEYPKMHHFVRSGKSVAGLLAYPLFFFWCFRQFCSNICVYWKCELKHTINKQKFTKALEDILFLQKKKNYIQVTNTFLLTPLPFQNYCSCCKGRFKNLHWVVGGEESRWSIVAENLKASVALL